MSSATESTPATTRQRKSNPLNKVTDNDNLPPTRNAPASADVPLPLERTPLSRVVYVITIAAVLVGAYYGWQILQINMNSRPDVPLGGNPETMPGAEDF